MSTNTDSILRQAAEALKNKQYPEAEALQRQACEILREYRTEESRLAPELETLADIHCIQKKFETCATEYAEVVKLREKLVPENDYSIPPLYRLARSHFEDQKYESAEAEMRGALGLAETRNDSPEFSLLPVRTRLASVLRRKVSRGGAISDQLPSSVKQSHSARCRARTLATRTSR